MPMFDYRCPMCNEHFERLTDDEHKDAQRHYPCGVVAARLPAAPAFAIHGYSAKNRYGPHDAILGPVLPPSKR